MKYVLLFVNDQDQFNSMSEADMGAMGQTIGEWWGKHAAAGRIVGGEQLQPPNTATTVRHRDGADPVITDGPFLETKEGIGGYAVVNVPDLDEALELAKTWPAKGTVEVRPLVPDESEHEHN